MLSKKAKGDSGISMGKSNDYVYYERVLFKKEAPVAAAKSKWSFKEVRKNTYLSGNNDRIVKSSDVEGCKKACTLETKFVCKSFDWYKKTK
jgi:hypothetical protein